METLDDQVAASTVRTQTARVLPAFGSILPPLVSPPTWVWRMERVILDEPWRTYIKALSGILIRTILARRLRFRKSNPYHHRYIALSVEFPGHSTARCCTTLHIYLLLHLQLLKQSLSATTRCL